MVSAAFALAACHASDDTPTRSAEKITPAQSGALKFTCIHEADHLPALSPPADSLFKYGRYLEAHNGQENHDEIARFYRIAAAYGHYKANTNLQLLLSSGQAGSPDASQEAVDLAEELIKQGVAGGYYDMAQYLESGYGVKPDQAKSLQYFRKAADLGSPDAQYYIAEMLAPIDNAPIIALQMRQCAAQSGHIKAADALGVNLQGKKQFPEALAAFQIAVKNGSALSAQALQEGFNGPPTTDPLNYLALPKDSERSARYERIGDFLSRYDGRNPKVPDIDKIVPLPPAPLPEWDGTFQWEKEFKSAKAPEMPSEALIKKLAQAKGLDPATGLPLAKAK